jgi:hypothetical protein
MANQTQSKYIADLAVLKTKEFKEVKELLVASEIVKDSSATVMAAQSLAEITNALTDAQASRLIDALIAREAPKRSKAYSTGRVKKTVSALDDITRTIDSWDFN